MTLSEVTSPAITLDRGTVLDALQLDGIRSISKYTPKKESVSSSILNKLHCVFDHHGAVVLPFADFDVGVSTDSQEVGPQAHPATAVVQYQS